MTNVTIRKHMNQSSYFSSRHDSWQILRDALSCVSSDGLSVKQSGATNILRIAAIDTSPNHIELSMRILLSIDMSISRCSGALAIDRVVVVVLFFVVTCYTVEK